MKLISTFFCCLVCSSVLGQDQKGLLIEDFSSNKLNWPVYSDTTVNWKVENGQYYRQNLKNLSYSTLKPVDLDPAGDYWIYLNTKHLGGVTNHPYGLSFGALNAENEFVFVIASTGHYQIYKRENGKITELVKWTETDAVYKTDNTYNSLWLIKEGKDWKFKINAKFVYSMLAQPLFGYNFGVATAGIQTVAFEELNINQILEHSIPPVRTIVKDTILMKEDFNNNIRSWAEYSDEYGTAIVKDGKYKVDHKLPDIDFSFYPLDIDEYENYSVSVNTSLSARGDSSIYGVFLGFKDIENYYSFFITSAGRCGVYKQQAGKVKYFIPLTQSSAIKKEEKAINILTVKQEEKSWKFFINDQPVGSLPAQSFYGNRIGVLTAGKQSVEFDDLVVKQTYITRFYKTKLCLIEKGILKEVDAEEAPYEITAAINGKKQTIRKYAPPDFPGYAANQSWFNNDAPVQFKSMNFSKSGKPATLGIVELKKIGDYKSIGVYADAEKAADALTTIYIPVRIGCVWQAYTIQCPSLELNAPLTAPVNDTLTFTADVTGVNNAIFIWTVGDGVIIKGQGTRSIQVSTQGMTKGSILDVSVELNPRMPGCENKKSKTIRVGTRPANNTRPPRSRN